MQCYTRPYNPCPTTPNAKCIIYTGSNLTNINVTTNDRLDVILQNINDSLSDLEFTLYIEDTATLDLEGSGTVQHPLYGNVNVSAAARNSIIINEDGLFSPNTIQAGVVYGGIVTWIDNYNYHVSAAGYYINGNFYESPAADFTLASPDIVDNRLDTFIVDATGNAAVLEGIPSSNPAQAPLDPAIQLELSVALVEVGTTQPTINKECLYLENTEWATLSSNVSKIDPNSLASPCEGVKSIRGTAANPGTNILFTRSSNFTPGSTFTQLNFLIRPISSWGGQGKISFRWELAGTPVGSAIAFGHGLYGFNTLNLLTCQIIAIPMTVFALVPGQQVDSLRITVTVGTLNFTLDEICVQNTPIVTTPSAPDEKVKVSANDTTAGYLNGKLVAGTGITLVENNNGSNETFTISASSPLTFDNGITKTVNNVQLGGPLVENTTIDIDAYSLNFTDGAGAGYFQMIPNSGTGTGTLFNIITDEGTSNSAVTIDGTQIALQGNTPASTQTYHLTVAAGAAGLSYTDTVDTYRVTVGQAVGGEGIELFGLANTSTQDALVGITSSTDLAGYISIGSGLSLASGVLSSTAVASITADNGLTANTATNVQLGGTLLANTTIDLAGRVFNIIGASTEFLKLTATVGSEAVVLNATNKTGSWNSSTFSGTAQSGNVNTSMTSTYQTSRQGSFHSFASSSTVINTISAFDPNVSTVLPIATLSRSISTGSPLSGLGGSLVFKTITTLGDPEETNSIISKLTDVTSATRTSQLIITGVNSAVISDLFTLSGSGALQLNKYGINTFTGTLVKYLAVDATGNVIEVDAGAGGEVISANNGITENVPGNVQLGGTLIQNSTITGGSFNLTITGTGTTNTLVVTSASGIAVSGSASGAAASGGAFVATANSGVGVSGTANNTNAIGVWGISNDGVAGQFNKNPSSTNTLVGVVNLFRTSSASAANGIGGSLDFYNETSDGSSQVAARIGSTWTDVTLGTRTGDLQFWTTNSATSAIKATLAGSGALRLHSYGTGSIGGTATFALSVDASGNVIETALGGAGFTNPMGAIGDLIVSSDGAGTPVALSPGVAGTVLTSNGAGAQPTWQALAGSGTVTTVSVVSANGFAGSVANPTSTPAITLTTSITGILKGNGTAISAAVAGTDYLEPTGSAAGLTSFPTFNQNTTGSAATLTTPRTINGTSFDGSTNITVTAAAGTLTGTVLNSTVVTSSLTSVGTISSGIWQGTAIGDTYISSAATWNAKQTGDATLTALAGLTITNGSIIYGTGADAFAVLSAGSNGQVLTLAGGIPSWTTPGVGGTVTSVGVSGGTTGLTTTGGPITTSGTITLTGTLIAVNGGTGQSSYTIGDILQASSSTVLSKLAAVATGNVLISGGVGTVSSWGKVGLTTHVTGDLPFSNLAQGSARSVLGVTGNSTADVASIQGTANQILRIDTAGTALAFGSINLASSAAVGVSVLPTVNGGTGQSTYTNGQLLIGNTTGNTLGKATLTAGQGIQIVNGAASITVASSFNPARVTLTDGSTITWNIDNGEAAVVTLGNINRTLSVTNPVAGRTYVLEIIQGSGGSKTISTWPTGTTWVGGIPPTLSTIAGQVDMVSFYYNGSSYRGVFNGPFA